tara:strand:- start:316 stop:1659 length:1344 start_codon:yes stop_codon:yes gene_type:complete
MKHIALLLLTVALVACSKSKPEPPPPEEFLTLADVSGRPTLAEDSPDVRVIQVKTKSFIKQNDLRAAKTKAVELATVVAVDETVRELLPSSTYNENYEKIEDYLSRNINNYVDDQEVVGERRIFMGQYYGISAAFKVNRQKVLVALQKDLKLINTSQNALVAIIANRKNIDLSSAGFTFTDLEEAFLNQIQTDMNQRGLQMMDYRNAIISMQNNEDAVREIATISKDQFMALLSDSNSDGNLLAEQIQLSDEFYESGLNVLRQLAKVVIEVNIFAVSGNVQGDLALSLNVTAKNIASDRGGAFANTVINVSRRAGPNSVQSAMIAGLVQDAYQEMQQEFVPQVLKEMSTISIDRDALVAYDLVFRGFDKNDGGRLRRMIQDKEDKTFRYLSFDNSVPSIISIRVRHAGRLEDLADRVMRMMDTNSFKVEEPIIAPDIRDLVFLRNND